VDKAPAGIVDLVRSDSVDENLKMFLAKGLLPLDSLQLIQCLTLLLTDGNATVRSQSRKTLDSLPRQVILDTCADPAMGADTLDLLSRFFHRDPAVLERILRHPEVSDGTLEYVAILPRPKLLRTIGSSYHWLERLPVLMVKLLNNPETPAAVFREWEKRQQGLRSSEDAPPAAGEGEKSFPSALTEEGGPAIADEEPASIAKLISAMPAGRKVALALKGNSEARHILIMNKNRAVCTKVLENPMVTDSEVEFYSRLTNLSTDVLRAIGANREWTSKPSIARNVVANPKTPLDVSLRLIGQLGEKSIKALTQNRNVPDALRNAAKHIWNSRKESK
jgi:hypothetical protein